LQEELAGLDLEKMLATDPANDGETGTG